MTSVKLHAAALAVALVSWPIAAAAQDPTPAVSDESEAHSPAAFQLSLWDSVQVTASARSIHGLRLTLPYGRNWDVQGVDIGIVSRTNQDLEGAQFSVVGLVDRHMKGLQYNWLLSSVGGEAQGAQFGVVNTAGALQGAQFGAVNYTRERATGASFAFVNVHEGSSVGAELGIVNYASRIEGVQFGLVNVTEHLHGVQIGLVNVARNGFLPVFVIFNAAL
ncbi:MAG: hypothetical protein ABI895_04325 [Deltaproteobacteria bacterium]